jgi:hypothetical protein
LFRELSIDESKKYLILELIQTFQLIQPLEDFNWEIVLLILIKS